MSDILELRVNDTPYSWNSCAFNIALAPYVGILALNFDENRERKLVHAGRRDGTPVGITSGKYAINALSMTMLKSTFRRFMEQLTLLGAGSYGDARFPILLSCSEPLALGAVPIVIDVQGCRVTGVKEDHALGVDELVTEVTMMGLTLTRNGMRLWSVVKGIGQ